MSQPTEPNTPFSWGVKLGTINVYESFTLGDTEYALYDCVYMRRNDLVDIGKIVKILEMEDQERKVEVVWFFKPLEIDCFLGDVKPLKKEVFLACGEGKGLSNLNSVEAIVAKCDVVCTSKDCRNPQPSEKELGVADYIFHRTFDVETQRISEEFPSFIAGTKVDHFFNKRSCKPSSVGSEPKAQVRETSVKGDCRFDVPDSTSSGGQMNKSIEDQPHAGRFDVPGSTSSSRQLKSTIKDRHQAGSNSKKSVHFSSASPSDMGPTKKRKLLSSGNRSDDALPPNPPTKASGEENHVEASCRENTDLSTGKNLLLKTSEFNGKGPVTMQHSGNRSDDALPNPPTKASGEGKHVKASCRENTDLSTGKNLLWKTSNRSDDALPNPPTKASGEGKHVKASCRENMDLSTGKNLLLKTSNRSDDALPNSPTKASGEEKHVKASCRENTDLSMGKNLLLKKSEFAGKGPVNKQHGTSTSDNYTEVTRRPRDASKWLKLEVWNEASLKEAHDKGTILVLENLDPSFAASEVEDIVWHVFKQKVKAKMLQGTAFSIPYFGQALVQFKTKDAADKVIAELYAGCLVLGDGRPIMVRRRFIQKMAAADRFVGHLSIDRTRSQRQRQELRNAVATSHFSQCNTIEFDMAMQWREHQEKSYRWWRGLREVQGKEIEALMKQMNIHCLKEK